MSLSKLPLLLLTIVLTAPWTAARADPCDEVLVSRAVVMASKRAQLAATQLVTREMYDAYRRGVTSRIQLLDRSLSDFNSYEALDDWRRLEASKDFFEYGADSARGAILAGTSEDFFSLKWKRCQFDDLLKQPPPAFRGWVDKLEPEQATVRLVASADPNLPLPDIAVAPSPFVIKAESPTQSRPSGRLVVERLVTVRRYPRADVRLVATIGNATTSVVVPSAVTGGLIFSPQVQGIDGPRLAREPVSFVVSFEKKPHCFSPGQDGEYFDVNTVRVTASSVEGGFWEVTKKEAKEICVLAGERRVNPKAPAYVVVLRVDKIRPRAAKE